MKVLNEYTTHHYLEDYEKTDWFCPNCGLKGHVWQAEDGDYYAGSRSICTSCLHEGWLQGGMSPIREQNVLDQAEQLKTGVARKPTTKPGN